MAQADFGTGDDVSDEADVGEKSEFGDNFEAFGDEHCTTCTKATIHATTRRKWVGIITGDDGRVFVIFLRYLNDIAEQQANATGFCSRGLDVIMKKRHVSGHWNVADSTTASRRPSNMVKECRVVHFHPVILAVRVALPHDAQLPSSQAPTPGQDVQSTGSIVLVSLDPDYDRAGVGQLLGSTTAEI